MNDTVHVFFDNTFVMGLHDLTNDITTVKFVVAKFNKQILYRDFVSNTLKNHVCESYNVLVDLPKVKKTLNLIGISYLLSLIVSLPRTL